MIVSAVFVSIFLLALVVIVGAVIYAIVGTAVSALRAFIREPQSRSSSDTPRPR